MGRKVILSNKHHWESGCVTLLYVLCIYCNCQSCYECVYLQSVRRSGCVFRLTLFMLIVLSQGRRNAFYSGGATFTSEEADLGFEHSIERLSR